MSINIAIKAIDGVLGMCDGRVSSDGDFVRDDFIKMHQLTPLVLNLFVGRKPNPGEDAVIAGMRNFYEEHSIIGVTEVSRDIHRSMQKAAAKFPENLSFKQILIGYNQVNTTSYAPHIYVVFYDNNKLQYVHIRSDFRHYVAGSGWGEVSEYLRLEIPKGEATLERMNVLAAKGMQMAIKSNPKTVGGNLMLYNLTPGKPLRIFTPEEILSLSQ